MKKIAIGFIMIITQLNACSENQKKILIFPSENFQRKPSEGYSSPSISEGTPSPSKEILCKGWQAITNGWQHEHNSVTFTLRQSNSSRGYMCEEKSTKNTSIISYTQEEIATKILLGTCALIELKSKSPSSPYERHLFFEADPQEIGLNSHHNFTEDSEIIPTKQQCCFDYDDEPRVQSAQEFENSKKNMSS